MASQSFESSIASLRAFNRFYTRYLGLLEERLLHSPYTLTQARLLFELAQHPGLTASALGRDLGLDPGYLSRALAVLQHAGLLEKAPAPADARQRLLRLTPQGEAAFALVDQRSHDQIAALLEPLPAGSQQQLLLAMRKIQTVLDSASSQPQPFLIRPPEPGDMGWVVHRHGLLYAQEYIWDARFEALVAQIVADFVTHFNPAKERCWIAELDSEIVGSVFLVQAAPTVAKLRLLLVEPSARGRGLGSRLIDECIRFARRSGYTRLTLWTNSVLLAARRLYAKAGFTLVSSEPAPNFGQDLVSETWELGL